MKVLLVDDHEENLLALEVILEARGLEFVRASSGAEALRCVLRDSFAVILLDVAMPRMDGFEVAQLVKQHAQTRHIPIIFLTAAIRDVESIYRGYEVGGVDYIQKPIDACVVRAKVAVFVELYRRGEEIQRQAELLREAELERVRGSIELRYRKLADAVPQLVFTAQPGGEISYLNQRWTSYTGASLPQPRSLLWSSLIHPSDVEGFLAQWGRMLDAGEGFRAECRLRSARGGYRWHLCELLPEHDLDHRLVGFLGTFTDVDERKRMEEERAGILLRAQVARAEAELSLHRFEFLAEASSLLTRSLDTGGILAGLARLSTPRLGRWCVVDLARPDGSLQQAAFAHESPALELLGGAIARRLRPEPGAASGVAGVLSSGQPELSAGPCDALMLAAALGAEQVEVVERLGAGAYLAVPLCARGQVLGVMTLVAAGSARGHEPADIALAVDLAQRAALAVDNARLYAGAQETARIREEFLSIASHELRTPLSALELQMQSIQLQLGKPEVDLGRLNQKIATARRQTDRLARLISEMLDVSRIESGRLDLRPEELDLGALVREVAASLAAELERAGAPLELDLGDGVIGCWDRLRLEQMVTNLLQNAVKYGNGKPIRVELRLAPGAEPGGAGAARLAVEDRGIGISAEDQARIFGRFERAVSSRNYGGMGVGLFIVDQIVKAHRGAIAVTSEPGAGATFVVELPLGPREARGAGAPSERSTSGAPLGAPEHRGPP